MLYVIAWDGDAERVLGFAVAADGSTAEPSYVGARRPEVVALDGELPERPASGLTQDLQARSGRVRVRIEHRRGESEVLLARDGADEIVVWHAAGIAAAPALAVVAQGVWVAFHHDVRESDHRPDVAKWIALRFVDRAGHVFAPAQQMRDRDRESAGVEQSFEFPELVPGQDGALSIFGRGSHNYWRQDLGRAGFTARRPLGDGEWGARGRHISAVRLGDGRILMARRERRGIELSHTSEPKGGFPELAPARVRLTRPDGPSGLGLPGPGQGNAVGRSPGGQVGAGASVGASGVEGGPPASARRDPAARHGRRTLFGDIQQHSAHSDGIGSAHEVYLRARDRYGDDFVALTDHESFLGKRTGPGEWRLLQQVAEHYDEPGSFATLIAYEWTGRRFPGPGHKCVYLPRTGLPIHSRDQVPVGRDLVEKVKGQGGFSSPHHIGWTGADEPGHDPEGQPLWEICSCHGCYEHVGHPLGQRGDLRDQMVDEMLRRGHRFGFTASSDSHGLLWHHGECRKRDPFRTGLTAVQATGCARSAIMSALRARRCYATSGAKILLDMRVADAPMGAEIRVSGPVDVRVEVWGTAPVRAIDLVGPGGVLESARGGRSHQQLAATVRVPWVYARVTQEDGEMAWASPVFVDPC